MNDLKKSLSLLPKGFEDLLPPDAENEFRAIGVLMKTFSRYGYLRVKPPMMEFEESLLAPGPGAAVADQTFRVMDPLSDKMLALRSDITAQIARLASSRMADEPRPLRITYANDALRTRASQQRTLRQFTQVGCELISQESLDADLEVAVLALVGLDAVGIQNVSIDFCVPMLVQAVLDDAGVSEVDQVAIKVALETRNENRLSDIDGGLKNVLLALLRASGSADKALDALGGVDLPDAAKALLARLNDVVAGVRSAVADLGLNVSVTIDPVEFKGFEYHCGIGFTLFAKGVNGELGRGGRYNIVRGSESESACGFTLYMDTVRQAAPEVEGRKRVYVPDDVAWSAIKALQDEGWITVRGFDGDDALLGTCTHVYKDGKVHSH